MWKLALLTTALVAIAALNFGTPTLTAGPPAYVVDTTSDDPDLDTGAPACDTGSGCSLRAAIDQANADGSGVITFDPGVFPPGSPATIALNATGNGELPEIVVPLEIDGSGAGVVIEPALASLLDYGFFVRDETPEDPTAFSIAGNSFAMRGFEDTDTSEESDGAAVVICGDGGDGCGSGPVRDVRISGLSVDDVAGAAIRVRAGDNSDLVVDGNDDLAGGSNPAVDARLGDNSSLDVTSNAGFTSDDDAIDVRTGDGGTITITGNGTFEGEDDGAKVRIGSGATVVLDNNGDLTGLEGDAATIQGGANVGVTIVGNGAIAGGDNGLELELGDDSTLSMRENGDVTGETDPAIQLEFGANANVSVSGHDVISSNDNAAIEATLGDNPELNVFNNGSIIGAGEGAFIESGEGGAIRLVNNNEIIGQDDDAIAIRALNPELHIHLNRSVIGQLGAGIDVNGGVDGGAIKDNGVITGGDGRGIDISAQDPDSVIANLGIFGNAIESSSEAGIRLKCDAEDGCIGGTGTVINDNEVTGNGLQGVLIEGGIEVTITDNTITDNGGSGVYLLDTSNNVVSLNVIERNGLNTTGVVIEEDSGPARGNTISQNSMAANSGLGIDLGVDGVTPNDVGDLDEGANGLLNAPEALAIDGSTVSGQVCAQCLVELFVTDDPPDESGYGEGMTFLGDVTADGAGGFSLEIPCETTGAALTATATDGAGNTSEFSANLDDLSSSLSCEAPTETPAPPTATATPTEEPLPDGDVNKDGTTNSVDALLLLQAGADLLPGVPNPENADVNQDSVIDSVDAALILQFEAGFLDSLPV